MTGICSYSSSALIKEYSQYIEISKKIDNPKNNQSALLESLGQVKESEFFLDGHFCLLNTTNEVLDIPFQVFDDINPVAVVSVYCDSSEVRRRVFKRDKVSLDEIVLEDLQMRDRVRAMSFCEESSIPFIPYTSGDSLASVFEVLEHL